MKRILAGLVLASIAVSANATTFKLSDKVAEYGKWQVLKAINPMTDKHNCMVIYDKDLDIQIGKYSFLIYMGKKGGVRYITNRVDDGSVVTKEATNQERLDDYALFEDDAFYPLLEAKRFRVKIDTVLNKEFIFDFDMEGFSKAVDHVRQPECS